jgi:hypothetical protein
MRRFRPAALHKLRTSVCFNGQGEVRRRPSGFLLCPSPALHSTLYEKLLSRSSLSTDSLAADRFNESRKTDTSGVSCRGIRLESRLLAGLPAHGRVPKDRSLDDNSACRARSRSYAPAPPEISSAVDPKSVQANLHGAFGRLPHLPTLAFRPGLHGLPHAAQSFQSRQGTVPLSPNATGLP